MYSVEVKYKKYNNNVGKKLRTLLPLAVNDTLAPSKSRIINTINLTLRNISKYTCIYIGWSLFIKYIHLFLQYPNS